MRDYPEVHQQGTISMENVDCVFWNFSQFSGQSFTIQNADVGVQIASDGRMWICVDGVAFLRFKPKRDARLDKPKEHWFFNNIREAIRVLKGE